MKLGILLCKADQNTEKLRVFKTQSFPTLTQLNTYAARQVFIIFLHGPMMRLYVYSEWPHRSLCQLRIVLTYIQAWSTRMTTEIDHVVAMETEGY